MKKFLFLLLGLTIAVSASAGTDSWRDHHPAKQSVFAQQAKARAEVHKAKTEAARQAFVEEFKAKAEAHKAMAKPETKLLSSGTKAVIDEQPDGDVMYFDHFSYVLGKGSNAWMEHSVTRVVIAPNGTTVYIEAPVSGYNNVWVRGTLSGNKITIPMGQSLYEADDKGNSLKMVWGTIAKDDDDNFAAKPKNNVSNATYTIDVENNTITLDNTNFEPTGPNFSELNVSVGTSGLLVVWDYELDEEYIHSYSLECASYYQPKQSTTPIYDDPDGEMFTYRRSGGCIDSKYTEGEQEGTVSVIYAPDGETVYISDIAACDREYTWVKGTIRDGKIVVPLGQYIYNNNSDVASVIGWAQCVWDNDEEKYIISLDPRAATVTYTIDGDNLVMDNTRESNGVREGLAVFDHLNGSDYFTDFCFEWNTEFIGSPHVIYDQPSGYVLTAKHAASTLDIDSQGIFDNECWAKIVIDPNNNTAYLQNPFAFAPEGSWVKGTLNGNTITIPLGQYVYWDEDYGQGVKLAWGTAQMNDGNYEIVVDPTVTEVTFTANNDGTVTLDNTSSGVDGDGAIGLVALWVWDGGDVPYSLEWDSEYTSAEMPTVITEQPEGELVTYLRNNQGINYNYDSIIDIDAEYRVVYAPDGETVYIQDPIAYVDAGTWVTGTLVNGKITVPLGQYIFWSDDGYGVLLEWGINTLDGKSYKFTSDPSVTEVTYTINGDYLVMDNSGPGDNGDGAVGLAATWDDGDGTIFLEFTPSTPIEVIEEEPEGELVEYDRSGMGIHTPDPLFKNRDLDQPWFAIQEGKILVVYAPDGETVYIQDIVDCGYYYNRGSWVQGTVNDARTKITIPLGQGVFYDGESGEYQILAWGSTSVGAPDEYGNETVIFTPDASVQTVTFTIQNGCMSMDNSTGATIEDLDALYDQYYNEEIDYETFQERMALLCQNTGLAYMTTGGEWTGEANWGTKMSIEHAAVPADPQVRRWYDAENEGGDSELFFYLPRLDVDGYALLPENISYSIYTDNDQLFTFDAQHYNLDADITEVPYAVWSNDNIYKLNEGYCDFFRTNAEGFEPFFTWRIGIQAHYTVDGVKNSSNIVYLEVFEHSDAIPGDVNGDGVVSVVDVTKLIDCLLGGDFSDINVENADFNGDQQVNVADVTALIDWLLGN